MERHGDKPKRMAVPQFGAWEQKGGPSPNYSVVFSQVRAKRKQAKSDENIKLGDEAGLVANRKEPDGNEFEFKLGNEFDFQPKNDFTFCTDKEDLQQPKYEIKHGGGDFEFQPTNNNDFTANRKEPKDEFKLGNEVKNEVKVGDHEANFTANPQPAKFDNEANVSSHQTYHAPHHGYHNHQYQYEQQHHQGHHQHHHHQDVGMNLGHGWRPIPQFGAWEQNGGASPNYSVVFSQARQNRQQAKKEGHYVKLNNEPNSTAHQTQHVPRYHYSHQRHRYHHQPQQHDDISKRRFLTYIKCCMRPQSH